MKLSDIFKQPKVASGETAFPEQFRTSEPVKVVDRDACNCDASREQIDAMNGVADFYGIDGLSNCTWCGHSAEEHGRACTHGSLTQQPTRIPLETAYLPHDEQCGCADVIAKKINELGPECHDDDTRTIVASRGTLKSTGETSEARRSFHHALVNTIMKLGSSPSMPGDSGNPSSETNPFLHRSAGLSMLEQMAEQHGGDIMTMLDVHRKSAGITLPELGIHPSRVGENYSTSQQQANQSALQTLSDNTKVVNNVEEEPQAHCATCISHEKEMQRLWDGYYDSVSRITGGDPDKMFEALKEWSDAEEGHRFGYRPPSNAHNFIQRAVAQLDEWRGSGHMYGEAHEDPEQSKIAGLRTVLEAAEPGSGNGESQDWHNEYNKRVYGMRDGSIIQLRGESFVDTLQHDAIAQAWSHVASQFNIPDRKYDVHTGEYEPIDIDLSKLYDYQDQLRASGRGYVADRMIKREKIKPLSGTILCKRGNSGLRGKKRNALESPRATVSDKSSEGWHVAGSWDNPAATERALKGLRDKARTDPTVEDNYRLIDLSKIDPGEIVTIDTGKELIKFHQRTRLNAKGEPIPQAHFMRVPYPENYATRDNSTRTLSLQDKPIVLNRRDAYILKRGAKFDIDKMVRTPISKSQRDSVTCHGELVPEQSPDGEPTSVVSRAFTTPLVPQGDSFSPLTKHECIEHDGHEFDSEGNITAVLSRISRLLKPEDRPMIQAKYDEALKNINPLKYRDDRAGLIREMGAAAARYNEGMGDIDINGNYIGTGGMVTDGGPRDLLGATDSEVRAETPTEKQQAKGKNKKNRTRKK